MKNFALISKTRKVPAVETEWGRTAVGLRPEESVGVAHAIVEREGGEHR